MRRQLARHSRADTVRSPAWRAGEHPLVAGLAAWQGPGRPAAASAADDQPADGTLPARLPLAVDRPGRPGRPHRRFRRRREEPVHVLHRLSPSAASGRPSNNGTTFEPLFDEIGHSIGDLALAPSNPNILYVGTGEPNNRQSSSFGNGVYKSTDAGETFTSHRPRRNRVHRPHHRPPKEPEHRVGRGGRPSLRRQSGARRLHDDGRRQDVERRRSTSTPTSAQPTSRSIRRIRITSSPPPTNAAAPTGDSSAADSARASTSRSTAARRGSA